MGPILQERKKPTFGQTFARGLSEGVDKYQELKQLKQQREALTKEGINPDLPQKIQEISYTGKRKQADQAEKLKGNQDILRDAEKRYGFDEGELEPYVQNPALGLSIAEKTTKQPKKTQASQPIDPEQLKLIENVRKLPEFQTGGPSKRYQLLTSGGVSRENAKAEAEIFAEEQKPSMFESESSKLAAKASSEYKNKIVSEYEEAESSDIGISKMLTSAKSGVLPTPLMVKTLESVGLPISVLNNPKAEEFEKIRANYVKNVASLFPGAIKNFEIESYMATIPGLLNSDEGKILIADNIKLQNEAKKIRYGALKEILSENGGVEPRNLDIAINDRTRNELNEIKQKYLDNVRESLDLAGPKITMVDDQGQIYDVPTNELEGAFKSGLKIHNE